MSLWAFWSFPFLLVRPRLHSFSFSLTFSVLSFSVLLHVSRHHTLLFSLFCTGRRAAEIQTRTCSMDRVSQARNCAKGDFAQGSASLLLRSLWPIWHPSFHAHVTSEARGGQIKPREKERERVTVRDMECVWGWLQIKGQHSGNSSLLRASSPSPPPSFPALTAVLRSPLCFREEMASPAPEDLRTSWAGPPSLQHPDPCHHCAVHAQQWSVRIGGIRVSVWFVL